MDEVIGKTRMWSYPKVYALGHADIAGIFDDSVIVQEKIDGSQFSFGMLDGVLVCKSHHRVIEGNPGMFEAAVEVAELIAPELLPECIYRAEYLRVPKHNTLVYDRIPSRHLILFDIERVGQHYLPYAEVCEEARRLNFDVVPTFYTGLVTSVDQLQELLETRSVLGGTTIEGVVVKNYIRFTRDGKAMMGKLVSECFKEKHSADWKQRNPSGKGVVETLAESLRTEARWEKAVQRMQEEGTLEGGPRDIGTLVRLVQSDLLEEEADAVKEALFKWAWPDIRRKSTAGLPEWYKMRLAATCLQQKEKT